MGVTKRRPIGTVGAEARMGPMTFLSIIWKNIRRRKSRSAFTAAGVAIGVGAGIAMCAIAWGVDKSFENAYLARGTDAIVAKITTGSLMPGFFDESRAGDVSTFPGVLTVATMLSDFFSIEGSEGVIVYGWQPGSFLWDHLDMREGSRPADDEAGERAYLGVIVAELLKKKAGDSLRIKDRIYIVAGIFESNSLVENGAVILPLPQLQTIIDRQGKVTFLNLRLDAATNGQQFDDLRTALERKFRGLKLYRAGEVASNLVGVQASKAMTLATSVIALAIGTLGIMNTVLMSVYERTRELGLMAAVGWRRRRIVAMVLVESVLISVAGALAGIVLGVAAVLTMQAMEFMRGKIEAAFSPGLFLAALVLAAGLGIAGALYPAWKAASIQPRKALL